ncbi:O-antigen ligase family protein [Pedobacter boryungensis]|uniref:O-antigen ligase family protein n=1 Tax=Pedobacter boryungensis TaxID=869962 RepID=A0ABX2DFW3_9SPHI|nr:O-antigen ligase family protein [Pedobacter boryungensis]NQX32439.1 O-antigen ligase family protein [Pedobacter boryungensis]
MIKEYLKHYSFAISLTLLYLVLAVCIMMLNRAFIVGALLGVIFLLFSFEKVAINKKTIGLSLLFVLVATIVVAIFLKSDSSLGRLLIYKISWNMFIEHPISGIGWGNFQREYGLYQGMYFQTGNYTQKEFLLADNSFYAFNDYWELIVETGIIGASSLFISIYFLVRISYYRLKDNPDDELLKLLLALLLVICIAALFTHVFEHGPFKIMLVFILSYLFLANFRKFKVVVALTVTVIYATNHYYFELKNINNYKKWEQAKILSSTGYILESQKIYENLYEEFHNNVEFLQNYNGVLGPNNTGKKIFLLKEILKRYTNHVSYLEMARLYDDIGMRKEAENAFLKAVYMVPNKFLTKEALFNFYLKHQQYKQAAHWRHIILTMPIKIPSERIEAIKQNVKSKHLLTLKTKTYD